MSLSQALVSAMSGLKVNQAALTLVSANVANADTPGYVRKTVNQVAVAGNNTGIGVRVTAVQRELDTFVQRQLRVENSGATYASTRANMYSRLQTIYGTPGSDNALDTIYNNFTTALQALSTSPDDSAARSSVISTAQALAQQLNYMSDSVQGLREDAELGIADAVTRANQAMAEIAKINKQLTANSQQDTANASLLDQRDAYIDQLSQLMDINVVKIDSNQVAVYTTSGVQLVGTQAAQISFDAQGTMSAQAQWTNDPKTRSVGTLTLNSPYGGSTDLIANGAIRSGEIGAYLQMRDQDLVQAQNQLDAIAAAMASALSDKTTTGTAVTSGLQNGFDVDLAGLQAGNKITINYTDSLTNTQHTITLVRVDDPKALPLSDTATPNANDKVYGIDFSAGLSSVIGQINQAIGSTSMVASNPSGTTLRILDDGAGNIVNVGSVKVTSTATSLQGGSAELPFFTDGASAYTGAVSSLGSQSVGFAGRITVNAALAGDPSKLVAYASSTSAGDGTRPDFLLNQLTKASFLYPADTGIGTVNTPFGGTITTFLRQVISQQGEAAASAQSLSEGQSVVLASLQQRFNDSSSVNVDQEMANLLTLQNSYAANARVLSAVKDMLDTLMKM